MHELTTASILSLVMTVTGMLGVTIALLSPSIAGDRRKRRRPQG